METPSAVLVDSVVTIIMIIIISKALTLDFYQKQSLRNENSP